MAVAPSPAILARLYPASVLPRQQPRAWNHLVSTMFSPALVRTALTKAHTPATRNHYPQIAQARLPWAKQRLVRLLTTISRPISSSTKQLLTITAVAPSLTILT